MAISMRSSMDGLFSSFTSFHSASSWFELYAAFSTFMMLLRTAINDFIPYQLRTLVVSKLEFLLSDRQSKSVVTLEISRYWEGKGNLLYHAAKDYLPTRITHSYKKLKVGKSGVHKNLVLAIDEKQEVVDEFEGIKFHWKLVRPAKDQQRLNVFDNVVEDSFMLSFHEKYREKVMNEYIPHIFHTHEAMKVEQRIVKIYSMRSGEWNKSDLTHPATFEKLALAGQVKQSIIDDLELFLERKELYKDMGKPWKRGYLLYGPPGTGKSSLIAAMAKKMRLDIYDLELSRVKSNSDLKRAMSDISHRSIIVIKDIDCNKEVQVRSKASASTVDSDYESDTIAKPAEVGQRFTLSALLNYMDGLWTSCGEDIRIIIFTTNHVEKLDPALLRPGRMDMHIKLPFCKPEAFRILAKNFGIEKQHPLLDQIDEILEKTDVTPAVLAEQLLRNKDPDVALEKVLEFLQEKETNQEAMHSNQPARE